MLATNKDNLRSTGFQVFFVDLSSNLPLCVCFWFTIVTIQPSEPIFAFHFHFSHFFVIKVIVAAILPLQWSSSSCLRRSHGLIRERIWGLADLVGKHHPGSQHQKTAADDGSHSAGWPPDIMVFGKSAWNIGVWWCHLKGGKVCDTKGSRLISIFNICPSHRCQKHPDQQILQFKIFKICSQSSSAQKALEPVIVGVEGGGELRAAVGVFLLHYTVSEFETTLHVLSHNVNSNGTPRNCIQSHTSLPFSISQCQTPQNVLLYSFKLLTHPPNMQTTMFWSAIVGLSSTSRP